MKKVLTFLLFLCATLTCGAADQFVEFRQSEGTLAIVSGGTPLNILTDPSEDEGVQMAVANLQNDFQLVCGTKPAVGNTPEATQIIVGTLQSSWIKKLMTSGKLDPKALEGKTEKYLLTVIDKPLDGMQRALVIAGSDKRGAIYGIYELSRQMGVSPWYWWLDVPVSAHKDISVKRGVYTDGEPAVRYRGIFINDEWPSFGTWCTNQFGGINSKAYARIFELLLRLKANFFWPAMWASRFNEDDPACPQLANDMGIVMGTSHHEPMMRAHKEYTMRRDSIGPWDYAKNPDRLNQFFTEGLQRNKAYDNIITIGMRGDGDVAMGRGDDKENMEVLANVIRNQREIIGNVYGRKQEEVPQLWAIFTEVQRYYDAGFQVPDDVTLLFCDNNWGYIRRKGTAKERKRKGGLGLYYHIDMNGGPWNDRWINTTTIPKLREQFNLAYQSGMDRIWIVNVGDLKPKEVPIDFIMKYAWNPAAYKPGDEGEYLTDFCSSIFGKAHASHIASLIARYSKYNLWRKPEVQYPGIFNKEEMAAVDEKWKDLEQQAAHLYAAMPQEARDAFFQLVYYPVMASSGVARIYNMAARGDSTGIVRLMERDSMLTCYYNDSLAQGKWRGMMLDKHIGYTKWSMPQHNANPMTLGFKGSYDTNNVATSEYSIPANQYIRKHDTKEAQWIHLPDLGRADGCMGIDNVMAESCENDDGPYLEYTITTASDAQGPTVAIGILPTQDLCPARGLRIGVSIDGGQMQVIDARRGLVDIFKEYTPANIARSKVLRPLPPSGKLSLSGYVNGRMLPRRNEVFDNMRWLDATFDVSPGTHTLRIHMIDPEVVVEQIVVNPDNSHYSYFGNVK